MTHIDVFVREYLDKVFYFCLKKTGNEQDAAELSSDIGFEVVQALSRGSEPENFNAWVWTIVRNRWSKWAVKKYYKSPEQVDIQDYEEVFVSEECVEADAIRLEEISLIRRELAFIRSDYRKILVAHYFEEMSVSEISRQFGIPLGTVKTKLQSSRKNLKEGMNMAREFGTKSFKPETISFIASGFQPAGLPWRAVERKIPVNILCETNNNPSTIEELSMELGIAMPYMEDEVEALVRSELLRKLDNGRYITNFFIASKECQNEINELSCQFAEEYYRVIWDAAAKLLETARTHYGLSGAVSEADAQAWFAFYIEQMLETEVRPVEIFDYYKRGDGGTWGFLGKENGAVCRLPRKCVGNNHVTDYEGLVFSGYQMSNDSIGYGKRPYKRDTPNPDELRMLKYIVKNSDVSEYSAGEKVVLECLLEDGFCVKDGDGTIRISALVLDTNSMIQIREVMAALPEWQMLIEKMQECFGKIKEIITRYSVPYLKEDFDYYVGMSSEIRGILAMLWKTKGLYTGGNAQFGIFIYN